MARALHVLDGQNVVENNTVLQGIQFAEVPDLLSEVSDLLEQRNPFLNRESTVIRAVDRPVCTAEKGQGHHQNNGHDRQ